MLLMFLMTSKREMWRNGLSIRLWIHEWLSGMGSGHHGAKFLWRFLCPTPIECAAIMTTMARFMYLCPWARVKALYSNCYMVQRSRKTVGSVYMYSNSRPNTSVHVKEFTGYWKRAGDHPGTVDCTSELHTSTLGFRGKVQLVCTQCVNT